METMEWKVLGISRTKDKNEITKAYRTKLMVTNPEDKPEEFKALREAYEKALNYASSEDEPADNPENPMSGWTAKLGEIYMDFRKRRDISSWRELLMDDFCLGIDSRSDAEDALLTFLLDYYRLPGYVWQLFDQTFGWADRAEELKEKYPADFIRYCVLAGIKEDNEIPYDYFEPGEDGEECDAYLKLYYSAVHLPYASEELSEKLNAMEEMRESHPYGQALYCSKQVSDGHMEYLEELRKLTEKYPDDLHLMMDLCDCYADQEDYVHAKPVAEQILALRPDHYRAKWRLAFCMAAEEKYEEAIDLLGELVSASGGDRMRIQELSNMRSAWNEKLIGLYEKELESDGDHNKTYENLAWNYFQNNNTEKAWEYASLLDPQKTDSFSYYNLMSGLYMEKAEYEKCLESMSKLIEVVENLKDDGSKKTKKRINRRAEMYMRRGQCYRQLDRLEEAGKDVEFAYELQPDNAEMLDTLIRYYYSVKNYEEAYEQAKKYVNAYPNFYHGHLLLAEVCHKLFYEREALDEVNEALGMNPSDLSLYLLKIDLFLSNNLFEEAGAELDFLCQNGLKDDLSVIFYQTYLRNLQAQQAKDMEELQQVRVKYGEIEACLKEDEIHYPWIPDFYYQYALIYSREKKLEEEEVQKEVFRLLDQGLKEDSLHPSCLDYKAWYLKRLKKFSEAKEIYHKLESMGRADYSTYEGLAEIYYDDLASDADKAYFYYKKLLEARDDEVVRFYCGMCCMYMRKYEEAELHFQKEREHDPEDVDSYFRMAEVYMHKKELEKALVEIDQAIELAKKQNGLKLYHMSFKLKLLRRMKKPLEALEILEYMRKEFQYKSANEEMVEVCLQFGLMDTAQKLLRKWKFHREEGDAEALIMSEVNFLTVGGHYEKASRLLDRSKKKLSDESYWRLKENCERFLKMDYGLSAHYLQLLDEKIKKNENVAGYMIGKLVLALVDEGKFFDAVEYAPLAIDALDQADKTFARDKTMIQAYKAVMLAVLGKFDEAREAFCDVDQMSLCFHCTDIRCLDADIFRLYVEIIAGNYDYVKEEAARLQEDYPADRSFTFLIRLAAFYKREKSC